MNKEAMTLKEGKEGYVGGLGGSKGKEEWCNYIIISKNRKDEEHLVGMCLR